MRLRATFLLAAVLAATAALPAGAFPPTGSPAPKLGTWHGKTSQGLPISFTVARQKQKSMIDKYYFKRVSIKAALTCDDQSTMTTTLRFKPGLSPQTEIGFAGVTMFRMYRTVTAGGLSYGMRFEGTFTKKNRMTGGLNISLSDTPRGDCGTKDSTFSAKP